MNLLVPKPNSRVWRYWIPDLGQSENERLTIQMHFSREAEDAATEVCMNAYDSDSVMEQGFTIFIRDDNGQLTQWVGWHEQSVDHLVHPHEPEEGN